MRWRMCSQSMRALSAREPGQQGILPLVFKDQYKADPQRPVIRHFAWTAKDTKSSRLFKKLGDRHLCTTRPAAISVSL